MGVTRDDPGILTILLAPEQRTERLLAAAAQFRLQSINGREADGPPTTVAFAASPETLHVLFEVASEPPLKVSVADGGPVYEDECVELFVADPLEPATYREIVVNPAGARYGALVTNPDDSRATWSLLSGRLPEGLVVAVAGEPSGGPVSEWWQWSCRLSVPWRSLSASGAAPRPGDERRLNAFRIARGAATRYLALSPTLRASPPDFHVPSRFARALFTAAGGDTTAC
jgi:hypothetical protein